MNTLIIICAKYLIIVPALGLGYYFLKANRRTKKKIFILSLLALPLTYLVAKVGSYIYFDPRPFVEGNFVPLFSHSVDNGFPSDHTLLASAFASVLFMFKRSEGLILLFVSFVIGFARVLAGVHHVVDIFGSILISLIITSLVNYLLNKYSNIYKN